MADTEQQDAIEWLESYLAYFDTKNIEDIDIKDLPPQFRGYFDRNVLYDTRQFPDPIGKARLEV